jgi:small subunit ribosomal protein S16
MVKLRLARQGRKKLPIYKIVATDSRSRRDGRFLESLGQYRPSNEPGQKVLINEDRALYWLGVGAQPTDTVRSLLSGEGILLRWHLDKKKVEPARASEILTTWKAARDAKHATIVDAKMAAAHARDEAKRKAAAKKVADAAAAEAAAIPVPTYTPVAEQESAPVEAPAVEQAPVAEAPSAVEPTPIAEAPTEAPQAIEEPAAAPVTEVPTGESGV